MPAKPRIAIVSPFLDKKHGTERCVVEQIERLAKDYEIHVYSNRVEDLDADSFVLHRIPALWGPHLSAYAWWFVANHLWRWWDRQVRGLQFDLVYTPGINCLDAHVIGVHIVFAEFYARVKSELNLRRNPWSSWPLLLHRRLYYLGVIFLERMIYSRRNTLLTAVSQKTAKDLRRYGQRDVQTIYHGVNGERFNPSASMQRRLGARKSLEMPESVFCLLLVGNDWKKKGLPQLLEAASVLPPKLFRLLVVGNDDPTPYKHLMERTGISQSVTFLSIRSDVEAYYAVADIYVGPALEDAFGLPPLEAMACGVPVVVSSQAGVSEIITDGVDGLVLKDPEDVAALAEIILRLANDPDLRKRLGENAALTSKRFTWERNAAELREVFETAMYRQSCTRATADQPAL